MTVEVGVPDRDGFVLSMVLTTYQRNLLRDLLENAANESHNYAAKTAWQELQAAVQSATPVRISTTAPANSLVQKVLEVGDRLRDGTVVIAVNLKKNKALFAPAAIFGGEATFDDQHEIPAQLNKQNAHGHNDWRNTTDDEGKTLSQVWDKVAPDELKGSAAPWFWFASSLYNIDGRVRRGGEAECGGGQRSLALSVPCVRSGPAAV